MNRTIIQPLIILIAIVLSAACARFNYKNHPVSDGLFIQKLKSERSKTFYHFNTPADLQTGIRARCQGNYEPWGSTVICQAGIQDDATYMISVEDVSDAIEKTQTYTSNHVKHLHDVKAASALKQIVQTHMKNMPVDMIVHHSFKHRDEEGYFTGFVKNEEILKQGIKTTVHHMLLTTSFFEHQHHVFFAYYTNDRVHSMNYQKMLDGSLPSNMTSLINSFRLFN